MKNYPKLPNCKYFDFKQPFKVAFLLCHSKNTPWSGSRKSKQTSKCITKTQYDPNAEVDYLDSQMKRIPFIAQMKALDFERYKVQYRQDGRLEAGMPVIDGRDQEALPGNSETVMQIDYKFLQDGLFLPDDSG